MVQLVLSVIEAGLKLIKSIRSLDSFIFKFILCFIEDFLFLSDKVPLRLDLVIKSDLLTFQLGGSFRCMFIFLDELAALIVEGLLALVNFDLTRLSELIKGISLLTQLLVIDLELLGEKGDLAVLLSASLVELIAKLCDIVVQLVLHILRLLLLEQDLVLVVDLSLGEPLIALVTDIIQSLLEAHFLRVIELLELSELVLGVFVDLVDSFLLLAFLLLELLFKLLDLLLQALLGGFDLALMLRVLLLAEG